MKKHSKKIFAALALILALACALTACAPAAASSGNAESKVSEAPASSKADEKPVTLKYIVRSAEPDSGNRDEVWKAVNEILLRDLNCTVEVEYLGSGDKAQMALKYAGNEVFDFAYSAWWWGFPENAQSNAFYELKMDELKQYAPYMVEALPDIAWKQASVGGKIYMLPNIDFEYSNAVIMYRGDLLEKYGLTKLKTMDDLDKYMELVAKNETGMEVLYTTFTELWKLYPSHLKGDPWSYQYNDPNKQVFDHNAMWDGYVEFAKKMRDFQEKGIISPERISDTSNQLDKFRNGLSAVVAHNGTTINALALSVTKEHPEWKVDFFNPYMGDQVILSPFTGNGFVITRTSEHPTKAIEVVNHIYESVELQKLLNYGVEGVNYEMKDGKLYNIADVPADKKFDIGCNWNMRNSLLQDTFVVQEMFDGYKEICEDFKKNTVSHPLQAFTFDMTAVETEMANLTAVDKEYLAIDYGMYADVNAAVAEYRQALKDAGYDKVKAEYDRQVKEFMATYNN